MAIKLKRKFLWGAAIVLGVLLLALLLMPVWLPWVLRPVAQRFGLHYAGFQREGFGRFALINVSYAGRGSTFHAARVETLVPTAWVGHRLLPGGPDSYLRVTDWRLVAEPAPAPPAAAPAPGPTPPASVYTDTQRLEANLARLLRWAPEGVLSNGSVQVLGQTVQLPRAHWANGQFTAQIVLPKYHQEATLQASFRGPPPYEIRLDSESLRLHSTVWIDQTPTQLLIQSTNLWLGNRVVADAQFDRTGRLPEQASAQAGNFTVPADLLRLPEFQDVHGSLRFHWQSNRFVLNLTAAAQPQAGANQAPINLALQATGNEQSALIENAKISAPWLEAALPANTRVRFSSPFVTAPMPLKFHVDLNRQPWFAAKGTLQGEVVIRPGPGKLPPGTFAVSGAGVQLSGFQSRAFEAHGNLLWPWVDFTTQVTMADGSIASLQGKLNLEQKMVQNGQLAFKGRFGQEFLPSGYAYSNAALMVKFGGPLNQLSHSGRLQVEHLTGPDLRPLQVTADWQGEQFNLNPLRITLLAGHSALALAGSASLGGAQESVRLTTLTLDKSGRQMLAMRHPFSVFAQPAAAVPGRPGRTWLARMEPFDWAGDGRLIHLEGDFTWPQAGRLTASVRQVDQALFGDFVAIPEHGLEIGQLNLAANWNNGPVNLDANLAASAVLTNGLPVSAQATLKGDGQGLSMEALSISTSNQPVATAHGFLPVTLQPGNPQGLVQARPDGPVRLQVMTQPRAVFWNYLAQRTGLVLQEPDLQANLSGTWSAPQGRVTLRAAKIQDIRAKQPLPPLENLRAMLVLDRQVARLEEFTLSVAGQPMTATGQIPLGPRLWADHKLQLPDWRQATGRLQVEHAQLAALAPFFPKLLSPQGILDVNLALRPGGNLEGVATVDGAMTQPLSTLGQIRDLEMRAEFSDRTIKLDAAGTIGGSWLSAAGQADLRGEQWLHGVLPPFQLTLRGTNVPLARQPELIARADVDATIAHAGNQFPLISGAIRLRDSLFLHDVTDLMGGRVAQPTARPPFFSVTNALLAPWRLNLAVTGTRFLRVYTPVFIGVLSANLRLQGTLKDPIALGDVKIDSGLVRFPFASLPVTQGLISLTSANPYEPQLLITAAAEALGYHIRMELTGPASKPVIQFISTPPLSSEQVLLMVVSGELPQRTFSLSAQQRAQTFGVFAGRSLLTQFGLGESTADRLTIRSGEYLSQTGQPSYSVRYRLDPNWAVIGERDEFNSFNLMFRWRVYSK